MLAAGARISKCVAGRAGRGLAEMQGCSSGLWPADAGTRRAGIPILLVKAATERLVTWRGCGWRGIRAALHRRSGLAESQQGGHYGGRNLFRLGDEESHG